LVPPALRAPIILVHGLLGFDLMRLHTWTARSYFPEIPDYLEAVGNRVFVPQLSPVGGVAERALQLKKFIKRHAPQTPVHILAHSMGGLDARYMISKLGMSRRVLSLTTIGTPHRGTSFADWCMKRLDSLLRPTFECLDLPRQAFWDLTTTACRAFNAAVPDAPEVRYFSVAGHHEGAWRNSPWRFLHKITTAAEGANDGVVSLTSAKYGESFEVWKTDHMALVNWPDPAAIRCGTWADRKPFYGRLVARLADEGL
jgi:triacylglycerol lipase